MVLMLICGAFAGCMPARSVEPRPPSRAGTTAFRLDDHLAWPYSLREASLFVDGRPVASRTAPVPTTAWLGQLSLGAGRHVVVLTAVVGFASDLFGGRCTIRLRALRVFDVAERPATVELDLYQRDVTHPFTERVFVDVDLRGAEPVSLEVLRRERRAEQPCRRRERAAELLCRAELRAEQAERADDRASVACLAPKLATLRSLADVRRRWLERTKRDWSDATAGDPAAMVLLAERRIETVWAELGRCQPYRSVELDELSRVVRGPGCEAGPVPLPLPADEP